MRSVVVPLMILTAILDEPQPRDCGTCSAACCPERLLCWIGSIPRMRGRVPWSGVTGAVDHRTIAGL